MIDFLHSFEPGRALFSAGPVTFYWYGVLIVLGMAAAFLMSLRLAKKYGVSGDVVFDLSFWMVVGGLVGARTYEVALMWPYYAAHPAQILQVWEGGLAIHGAIIGGLFVLWAFSRRYKLGFWRLTSLFVPGVALGQAIGRWGNYFNQELFGRPTDLPWGIPISAMNRPLEFIGDRYFHPTFLYESLGCLAIAAALLSANYLAARKGHLAEQFYLWSVSFYVISYSLLRFSLEFVRLDETPFLFGWRWPQIISILLIILAVFITAIKTYGRKRKDNR